MSKRKFKAVADNFTGFTGVKLLDAEDPQVRGWWRAGAIVPVPKSKKVEK